MLRSWRVVDLRDELILGCLRAIGRAIELFVDEKSVVILIGLAVGVHQGAICRLITTRKSSVWLTLTTVSLSLGDSVGVVRDKARRDTNEEPKLVLNDGTTKGRAHTDVVRQVGLDIDEALNRRRVVSLLQPGVGELGKDSAVKVVGTTLGHNVDHTAG